MRPPSVGNDVIELSCGNDNMTLQKFHPMIISRRVVSRDKRYQGLIVLSFSSQKQP